MYAMRAYATPKIDANAHQIAITPSDRTHKAYTVVLAFGLKVASRTQAEVYLAIRFLIPHVTFVNVPPNMILPLTLSTRIV